MPSKKEIEEYSDEELIELIGKTNEAENEFYRRYKRRVRWFIRNYRLNSLEREDLIQEGMIGLFDAIATFDPGKGFKFSTYATTCIRNRINNAFNALYSQNKKLDTRQDVEEIISDDDPEQDAILWESMELIENAVKGLEEIEKKVLIKYIDKKSYQQIADELDISTKKVDNILSKIKNKLSKKLKHIKIDWNSPNWGHKFKNSIQKGLDDEIER